MKDSQSQSDACPTLKSLSNKLGKMIFCHNTQDKYKRFDNKLERKMIEMKKGASKNSNFRTINGIIMRFPHIKEGLKVIKSVFEKYDEDSNGTIDHEELNKCLHQLQLHIPEREIDDLFYSCDIDGNGGIQFREFIVLLCLIYLLFDHSNTSQCVGSIHLLATFDTIIEAFLFLDKNGDGKLNKKVIIKALNEESPGEKSPIHISRTRFEEMDWDGDGKVSFREFLFSLIDWVGIDGDDENFETG